MTDGRAVGGLVARKESWPMNKALWGLACVLLAVMVVGCKKASDRQGRPSTQPAGTQATGQKVYRPRGAPTGGRGAGGQAGILGPATAELYSPVVGRFGGRIVLASLGEPKTFNPIVANETSSTEITGLMWEGLTTSNPWTSEAQANLATSWTHDDSGLIWTVRLREGVVWSDGAPFTADDVLFTYETIYNLKISAPMRDLLTGPKGEQWKLEKIDDLTVRFALFEKNAVFPQLIAQPIIPKHVFKRLVDSGHFDSALSTDTPPEKLVGNGPFLLARYEIGRSVVMKRNGRYWMTDAAGQHLPYLEELVFLTVLDLNVQMLKFQNGEIDILQMRPADFPILAAQTGADFDIYRLGPRLGSFFLFFNQNPGRDTQGKPFVEPRKLRWFRDRRFRQAMSHAIDRQSIVDNVFNGLAYPQYTEYNEVLHLPFGAPDLPRFEYDPAKGKALLAEMGLADRDGDGVLEDSDGGDVEFNLTTNAENTDRVKVAEVIRKDLETLGIRVNFRPMSFNTLVSKLDATYDWEACLMGLTGSTDPHWGANVWRSSGHTHMWFPKQPRPATDWEAQIDRVFDEGIKELDEQKRREVYWRYQRIATEELPLVYVVTQEGLAAIRTQYANIFPTGLTSLPQWGVLAHLEGIYIQEH
ncbi:MAG: ABC transporter substrate-binding protein [Phycisphaerae bacterium]|nr:ABC transporter substrate-binding protein [Phycisphaerae bacterium]